MKQLCKFLLVVSAFVTVALAAQCPVTFNLQGGPSEWNMTSDFNIEVHTYTCTTKSDVVQAAASNLSVKSFPVVVNATCSTAGQLVYYKVSYIYDDGPYVGYSVPSGLTNAANVIIPTNFTGSWSYNTQPDFSECSDVSPSN